MREEVKENNQIAQNRRKYIRINTVFPVSFQIHSARESTTVDALRQGFTRDISEGGMCLEINELDKESVNKLYDIKTRIDLYIDVPFHRESLRAKGQPRWINKADGEFPNTYHVGVEYVEIAEGVRRRLLRYAKSLRRRPKVIAISLLFLVFLSGIFYWQMQRIKGEHVFTQQELVALEERLFQEHEIRTGLENRLKISDKKYYSLAGKHERSEETIVSLEERLLKLKSLGDQLSDDLIDKQMEIELSLGERKAEQKAMKGQMKQIEETRKQLKKKLIRIKDLDDVKIVNVRLSNGNLITGELLNISPETLNLRVGAGKIGIERNMVKSIEELSKLEKYNIQEEWNKQEQKARIVEEERRAFIRNQRSKGLVYLNGQWTEKTEAEAIQRKQKEKEDKIFELIAKQSALSGGSKKQVSLLEALLQEQSKPLISIRDNRLYVNGKLFFIKGVAYGIEYPGTPGGLETFKKTPFSVFEKDFAMMKEMGINTIRTYQPLPDKLLDCAQKNNIMVIENLCYPTASTDFSSRVHLNVLKEQIRQYVLKHKDRNCILMWSIWNDAPWVWGNSGNVIKKYGKDVVDDFLKELYDTVKQYDSTRPVTAANALGLEDEDLGWGFLDVIGLNVYIGGYDWFSEGEAKRQILRMGEITKQYNKPVVILETGFSTFIKGLDQGDVLKKQIQFIGESVSGITIFQWADGWQKAGDKDKQDDHIEEHWGILDGYRKPKSGYSAITEIFNSINTESKGYSK